MEGIQEHVRLQALAPIGYEKEVSVSLKVEKKDFDLEIFGRIDGLLVSGDKVLVEEIKTCQSDPDLMSLNPSPRHLAQLKCYGYMVALERKLDTVDLRLTYARVATRDISHWNLSATQKELEKFFNTLVAKYMGQLSSRAAWEGLRNRSIASLDFPYSGFREGQRDLAKGVYKIVKHNKILFARAPTGTGKTMACLYPAVKALGLGLTDKIFYLTAKSPGRTVAIKAVKDLAAAGARLKSVVITAKQKTCFFPDTPCDMETCSHAHAYYTKLHKAMAQVNRHDHFDQERIESLGRTHEICPFELSLDLSLTCDVIICDLNYVFDPRVYLKRFFDRNDHKLTFLMDEAHNLPDRLRSMYSADLSKSHVLETQEILRDAAPSLAKALVKIHKQIIGLKTRHLTQGSEFSSLTDLPEEFMDALDLFLSRADFWLDSHPDSPIREAVLDLFFRINGFSGIARHFGSHYRFFIEKGRDRDVLIRLFCLDPSPIFSKLIKRCHGAILFSATFFPFPYYQQILFGRDQIDTEESSPKDKTSKKQKAIQAYTISLSSPFPRENLKLIIHDRIKTTYRARPKFYRAVADVILTAITSRTGNYLVFFPSYVYMDAVKETLDQIILDPEAPDSHKDILSNIQPNILVQSPGMAEDERHQFLDRFTPEQHTLGFAVMGGIFGEGIDLTGDSLIGVIVVGVGLPQICDEQNEIRAYYDGNGEDGFFNAYQMPGFSRVLQAMGRLIRSAEDRGTAILIDERFMRPDYQSLFPEEWTPFHRVQDIDQLAGSLDQFWSK